MHRLKTVTYLNVSAVAGHHAMPAALLFKCTPHFGRGLLSGKQTESYRSYLPMKKYRALGKSGYLRFIDG